MPAARGRVLACLAVAGLGFACARDGDDERLKAYGVAEARQVAVSSLTGGRILQVLADEGDAVKRGQALVRFDLSEVDAQRAQAQAGVEAAGAQLRLLERGAQREDIQVARRALEAAQIRAQSTATDLARAEQLYAGQALPLQSVEGARTLAAQAQSEVATRAAQLDKVLGGARAEERAAAAAARDQAQAALGAVDARLEDREIEAPLDALVVYRLVEPGEVARPGAPLLVLGDLAHPYLDVYVPELRMSEARRGAAVEVRVDAYPGRLFKGAVGHVASVAEFTPKNVQTADQRARLVFRVRIEVEDPEGLLRPGMPGEAVFGTGAAAAPERVGVR